MRTSEHTLAHHIQCALTRPLPRHELEALMATIRPYLEPQPGLYTTPPQPSRDSGTQSHT